MAPMTRRRRATVSVLLVALMLVTVLAIVGLWAKRQALDTSTWERTNTELISDPAIQAAVAGFLVDTLYEDGEVAATISGALPVRLQPLAGPLSGALRDGLERTTRAALGRPELQRAWAAAVQVTHGQVIALVKGEEHPLSAVLGKNAVLDLRPLLGQTSARLGLPPSVLDAVPQSAGRVRVVSGADLEAARTTLKWIERLVALLVLLVPGLVALIVWLSPGDRRAATLRAGAAVAFGALVVLGLRGALEAPFVDALAATEASRPSVEATWRITTSVLGTIASVTLALAVVLLAGALLAGPATWAARARERLRPALERSPEVVHGAVVGTLLLLVALSAIPNVTRPLSVAMLLAACVAATELVRRATVAELDRAAT